MTPLPPASSGEPSIPPRHRPNLGNFNRETTELDLWALDDLDGPEGDSSEPSPKGQQAVIPVPRNTGRTPQAPQSEPMTPRAPAHKLSTQSEITTTTTRSKVQPPRPLLQPSRLVDHFDDLEDLVPITYPLAKESAKAALADSQLEEVAQVAEEVNQQPVVAEAPSIAPSQGDFQKPNQAQPSDVDEFTPRAREGVAPLDLRVRLGLSKLERIGLAALFALVVLGGGSLFYGRLNRLAAGGDAMAENQFPIKGNFTRIIAADTYWRAPVIEGPMAEKVRPGTQLIPVIKLTAEGSPAGIKVLFRNSDGRLVGDALTRTLNPGASWEVAATTGFNDAGMFAAYRAGQGKPWTVEVEEAPTETASNAEFKKLLNMAISTAQR